MIDINPETGEVLGQKEAAAEEESQQPARAPFMDGILDED